MSQQQHYSNTVAPLTNVSRCLESLQLAMGREVGVPGMVVFYGPSGYGKSKAAAFLVNTQKAIYVECRSVWTKKVLLAQILREMGLEPEKTICAMLDQICDYLASTQLPLIIDEMDHLVEKKSVEVIRDIYEGSGAPILMIGEENLPKKLERWERFDGRILDKKPAMPIDLKDVAHLAHLYCRGLKIDDELLIQVHALANGSARRVTVNLARLKEEAKRLGIDKIGPAEWGHRQFYTGKAPARR